MNEEIILNRILEDAKKESKQIIDLANAEIENLKNNLNEFDKQLNQKTTIELEKYKEKCIENYESNLKFNKSKIVLEVKNNVLDELKNKAIEKIKSLKKNEMIAFLSKIIEQNAENNEILKHNISDIEDTDLIELDIVKRLNLQVKKDSLIECGIMLSTEIYDKNLSFKNLAKELFNEKQKEIYEVLF